MVKHLVYYCCHNDAIKTRKTLKTAKVALKSLWMSVTECVARGRATQNCQKSFSFNQTVSYTRPETQKLAA